MEVETYVMIVERLNLAHPKSVTDVLERTEPDVDGVATATDRITNLEPLNLPVT